MFDLNSNASDKAFVHYKTFKVADESDSYRLTIEDYQTSGAGNAMAKHNNMAFSTNDQDNDLNTGASCSQTVKGGWWYNSCGQAKLSGEYGSTSFTRQIKWETWTGHEIIDEVEMKIRSKSGRFQKCFAVYFHPYRSHAILVSHDWKRKIIFSASHSFLKELGYLRYLLIF